MNPGALSVPSLAGCCRRRRGNSGSVANSIPVVWGNVFNTLSIARLNRILAMDHQSGSLGFVFPS